MLGALKSRHLIAIGAVLVLIAGVIVGFSVLSGNGGKRITVYFDHTVGVYPGSDLRVLGVRVGSVSSVTPEGQRVRVVLSLDAGVPVPADATAVVVAPSVVADRYVQLTPAYTGGSQLGDGAVIYPDHTDVPAEVDQLYQSVTQLAEDLGPNGANNDGALNDLLKVGADNLAGNGQAIGDTIAQLGSATKTLSGSSNDLFSTINYLQQFTGMLKNNDSDIRQAEQQLSQVTGFLAADRGDLAGALSQLSTALGQVKGFIQNNRDALADNVNKLAAITQTLVDQKASLAEALSDAPLATDNVVNSFDASHGTLDGRADLTELPLVFPQANVLVPGSGR